MSAARALIGSAPVWTKLLVLVAGSAVVVGVDRPGVSLAVAAVAAVVPLVAGVPRRPWRRLVVPVVTMVVLVGVLQWLTVGVDAATSAALRLLAVGLLAVAFTLTTPAATIVAWVESLLARLRVRPDRVFRVGLTVGLTTRAVDHLGHVGERVLDARRARGLQRSVRAFAVPMVVEAARFAHGVGEALDARGIADPAPAVKRQVDESGSYIMVGEIAAAGDGGSGRWIPRGHELGPANERPPAVPPHLVLEALAQFAGRLLAARSAGSGRWLLAGLDDVEVRPAVWDEPVIIGGRIVRCDTRGGRVQAVARQGTSDVATATVMMAPLAAGSRDAA